MKALTLHGCFAHAVIHGPKNVENRSWAPPESLFGQRIAIHAGKNPGDKSAQAQMRVALYEHAPPAEWPTSAIIGTVRLAGFFLVVDDEVTYAGTEEITNEIAIAAAESRWYSQDAPFGWLFVDPQPCPPVPCKGALGLWTWEGP